MNSSTQRTFLHMAAACSMCQGVRAAVPSSPTAAMAALRLASRGSRRAKLPRQAASWRSQSEEMCCDWPLIAEARLLSTWFDRSRGGIQGVDEPPEEKQTCG